MTGGDVAAAAALQAAAMPNPWSVGQFIDVLRPGNIAHVVEVDNTLVAVAVVSVVIDQCDLLTIAVDVRYQRCGYGALLLRYVLSKAARRGARECFLEVMEGNATAIALYRSFDFEVVGVRRRYYQLPEGLRDAIVMRGPCVS